MMKKLSSLSIFFPSLNDANALPLLVAKAVEAARGVTDTYEIIVINDGSLDDTKDVLTILSHQYPRLRAVHHQKNRGYGGALQSGFNEAKYDWVFYTDGDGQYDPLELEKLVEKLHDSIEVVNGFKLRRSDSLIRTFVGYLYNVIVHFLYRLPIRDIQCDFRLIHRSALKKIHLTASSGLICLELVYKLHKAGIKFAQVKVSHYPRMYGDSQFFTFEKLMTTLREHVRFYHDVVAGKI